MYIHKEKMVKKISSLIIGMKVLLIFSILLFLLCFCLIVWGNGKLIGLLPLSLFMVIWLLGFYSIYSYIAYKIPIEISINGDKFNIICKGKKYLFDIKDFIFRGDGVCNIVLRFKVGKRKFTFYLPKFFGNNKNLNDNIFNCFNVQKSKIKYDFFLRIF